MGDKRISLLSLSIFLWASLSPVWATVWYDNKAILINGQRKILISGSIHYPRSTPEMWPDLMKKAKEGGIDVIQTYVFWNGHEPTRGNFNFAGRYDLVKFIRLAQQAGLYVHLRIGPYVCAEWNFGGFPVWLKYIPNIQFRTDNEPFKAEMYKFTAKIVSMMKSEKLFQPQGGPIIMSQIENEYGPIEWELKAPGKAYTKWFSQMATGLNTDVPWIMCKQEDAPGPIIDACNGFYCDGYTPNANNKPKMWTEAWTAWFTEIGKPVPYRPVEDLAFGVARFFQKGGSYINYYMYHGGTNFDRTSGLFVATSYDYDAPIDEYGLLREPKWGHLRDLHKAIKQCEPALVSANPTVTWPGKNLEVTVYNSKSGCAAFLANHDPSSWARVMYQNHPYDLAPWSVSILPDCKTAVFNTAKVNVPRYHPKMTPVSGEFPWQSYIEQPVVADDRDVFTKNWLVEQKQTTWDTSDYLWYTTNVFIKSGDWKSGSQPTLSVNSAGHVLHVFVNGQKAGTVYGSLKKPSVTFNSAVKLQTGLNKISLLSVTVGLPNVDVYFDTWNAGVLGPVTLNGLNGGTWDLGKQKWSYKVGLRGESQKLNTFSGSSSVKWSGGSWLAKKGPLTWYKTWFDAPWGNEPLALDMYTMGKGRIWINGESIGRHWSGNIAHGNCGNCSYNGLFNENKCLAGCGEPSQRWYHIPRSWLKPKGNFMVILEESGGDPSGIRLVKRTTS